MEKSDIELLKRLITSDRLTNSQYGAFTGMLSKLLAGDSKELTGAQRQWAEDIYEKLDLQAEEGAQNLISSGRYVPTEEERLKKYGWETMPKPLKPPGR